MHFQKRWCHCSEASKVINGGDKAPSAFTADEPYLVVRRSCMGLKSRVKGGGHCFGRWPLPWRACKSLWMASELWRYLWCSSSNSIGFFFFPLFSPFSFLFPFNFPLSFRSGCLPTRLDRLTLWASTLKTLSTFLQKPLSRLVPTFLKVILTIQPIYDNCCQSPALCAICTLQWLSAVQILAALERIVGCETKTVPGYAIWKRVRYVIPFRYLERS